MPPLARLRRIARLGPRKVIALRRIRALRDLGLAANAAANPHAAIAYWSKMMALQRLFANGTRYLRSAGWTNGIGHIALLDFFVKRQVLGLDKSQYRLIIDPAYVANKFYLSLWLPFFSTGEAPEDIELHEDWPMLLEYRSQFFELHKAVRFVNEDWVAQGHLPLITLPDREKGSGWGALPTDKWFVTIHIRCGEEPQDSIRNIRSPWTYQGAIDAINDAGGQAVLIGKPGVKLGLRGVLDRRGSPDWLDTFLISQCRFFIGSNSGPAVAAGTFGKPILIPNYAPSGLEFPYPAKTIPKVIGRVGSPLPPQAPEYLRYWTTTQLAERGLRLQETPEAAITAATQEMLCNT